MKWNKETKMKLSSIKALSIVVATTVLSGTSAHVLAQENDALMSSPVSIINNGALSTQEIEAKRKATQVTREAVRNKLVATMNDASVEGKESNLGDNEFLNNVIATNAITGEVATESNLISATTRRPVKKKETFLDKVKKGWKPNLEFNLDPKGNIAIPVAAGLTNRIATNFKMIAVKTHDDSSIIELEDGMMYITLKKIAPVGIMLFEEGVPESMVNVTLFPFDGMLPTMVDINVKLDWAMRQKSKVFREDLDKKDAIALATKSIVQDKYVDKYTARIESLLSSVAKGDIPSGFTLSTEIPKELAMYPCAMPITNRIAQRIIGGREIIDVVLVTNDSNRVYTVQEKQCYHNDAMAAAVYQRAMLQPGQSTEMYILRDKLFVSNQKQNKTRPVLVR
jgi:conjugal transfer pilus assembly protein TraK